MSRLKFKIRDLLGLTPKLQRGDVVIENAKVKISLPEMWGYYPLGVDHYLIGADKEIGAITFSAQHLVITEEGPFINFYTNQPEEFEVEEVGRFETYVVQGQGQKEWCRVYETETQTHFVRFMYMCDKSMNHIEQEVVWSIVNSLEEL